MSKGVTRRGELSFPVLPGCHALVLERLLEDARLAGLRACDPGDLQLVVEEVLTNVVKYSGAAGMDLPARVWWSMSASELELGFEDPGVPFDPLGEDESSLDDDDRCEGGMGILLVRALADTIRYSREHDRNCLALSFRAD